MNKCLAQRCVTVQVPVFRSVCSIMLSRMCRGCQERGYTELRETLYSNITEITEIAGEQVHTKITLILDKDTGNTEDL